MQAIKLFCDASVNPTSGIGFGACLLVSHESPVIEELAKDIQIRRFEATTAARLELQNLLWALHELIPQQARVVVHTDSQTICQLPQRQQRLESNNFCSSTGQPLNNADLYREFFHLYSPGSINFCKQRGHLPPAERSPDDQIFRLVDKASRKALRQDKQKAPPCS